MVYISEMVYDRNKLPMEHMFSVKLSKGVKSISEVTMTLAKKRKFDICSKQRWALENVLFQHQFIRALKGI